MINIRNLVESRTHDAGNFSEGAKRSVTQLLSLMPVKLPSSGARLLDPRDISLREAFDALVVENWRQLGRDVSSLLSGNNSAMIAEAINTSQFPRLLQRQQTILVLDAYELALEGADRLVTDIGMKKSTWVRFNRLTGKELPELVREAHAYEETKMGELEVRFELHKFGRLLSITKEMVLEDETGSVVQEAQDFGTDMGYHRQREIFETVTGQASTATGRVAAGSFNVNGTNYSIYADTHATVPGSGSQANDNNLTSNALAAAGLSAAVLRLRKIVNLNGIPIAIRPTHLIVAPEQEEIAMKLNQFTTEPGASAAFMDGNVHKSRYTTVVDPNGTAGTWYFGAFARQARYAWNWKPGVQVIAPQERSLTHDIVMLIQAGYKGGCGNVDHKYALKSAA